MPVWTEVSTGQPLDSDLGPPLFPYLDVGVEGVFIPGLDQKIVNMVSGSLDFPTIKMIHELINNNNNNYGQRGKYRQESIPLVQILTPRNSPFYYLVDNFPDVCLHVFRQT